MLASRLKKVTKITIVGFVSIFNVHMYVAIRAYSMPPPTPTKIHFRIMITSSVRLIPPARLLIPTQTLQTCWSMMTLLMMTCLPSQLYLETASVSALLDLNILMSMIVCNLLVLHMCCVQLNLRRNIQVPFNVWFFCRGKIVYFLSADCSCFLTSTCLDLMLRCSF